jgi:ATP-dependent Clp protease ATP-binding subunit ClpC
MARIIEMKLNKLADDVLIKHNIQIHVKETVIPYLTYDKLDSDADSGGARIVLSKLEREITVPLSKYINEHSTATNVYIDIAGGMAIEDKRKLESDAWVYINNRFLTDAERQLEGPEAKEQLLATII